MQVLKVKVKPKLSRLDRFVSSEVKNLTRSQAKKLIKEGYIVVNDSQSEPDYQVEKGDTIKIEIPAKPQTSLLPEKIPLKIVFEDQDLIVIDKQPGLVIHPTVSHPSGTLVNALLAHVNNLFGADDTLRLRPGIVHRLDKDTSGLLVVAKNQKALENLKRQFKDRLVQKKYLSLVHGSVKKEQGEIKANIDRHPKFKSKFVVSSSGREALTKFKVLKRFGDKFTLLELEPKTGRTHQLRVHLSHMGHPIVGDKTYGGKMFLKRQFLHSAFLKFKHPASGETLEFSIGLPKDLSLFLTKLNSF